jgi:hypothetical protein
MKHPLRVIETILHRRVQLEFADSRRELSFPGSNIYTDRASVRQDKTHKQSARGWKYGNVNLSARQSQGHNGGMTGIR